MKREMKFRQSLVISQKDDTHGYYDIAKQIARAFLDFKLPVTVVLSGGYGSGKSSIVAMALKELKFPELSIKEMIEERKTVGLQKSGTKKSPPLGVVFLDAGLWEDTPNLFSVLLLSIAKQFGVEKIKSVKDSLKKVFFVSISILNIIGVTKLDPDEVKRFGKHIMRRDKVTDQVIQDVANRQRLRDEVGKIFKYVLNEIEEIKKGPQARLLVILDNLDRVTPEQTLDLLISIHLYIPKDTSIFILTCFDREFIENHITEKFGIADSTAYLSKYIDFFWGMPLPKRKYFDQVVSKLLNGKEVPEQCFKKDEFYLKILEGMLYRAGVVTPKMLEMILRRFIFLLNFYWNLEPKPTMKQLYNKVEDKTDLLNSEFGVKVAEYFYLSLMYMRWPWLYNSFYLFGEAGKVLEYKDDINCIISKISRFCGKEKIDTDPYVASFLNYYHYLTFWSNPGATLLRDFRPSELPIKSIRKGIISELQKEGMLASKLTS